jgi:phosphoglycerate-specific signal transduction histidine kinase
MKVEVNSEDILTWSDTFRADPAQLRELAGLARRLGWQVRDGAAELQGPADELAWKLHTVLSTLAQALESLHQRTVGAAAVYTEQELRLSSAIGAHGG